MADNQSNPAASKSTESENAKPSSSESSSAQKKASKPPESSKGTPAAKPADKTPAGKEPIYAPARPVRSKRRHWMLLLSFVLFVLLPSFLTGTYLWSRAVDQYTSSVGFTVRQEEAPSAIDFLGGLSKLSGNSSSDSDILFEFIQSQEMVERVDQALDLRSLYSRYATVDPIFSLSRDSSIEELVAYWQRMVLISYAPGTGLIELKVLAFDPKEAQLIATVIFEESGEMINMLSAIAREDTTRYAREDLDNAVEQLKEARQSLTAFRSNTQIVDPSANIQMQMGLLNTLQQQLGEELINYDMLLTSAQPSDPRLQTSQQRIDAIRARIREEREKFGNAADVAGGEGYASLLAEFERLTVDQEFAERKYTAALSNYDAAKSEAQRQSRYLAPYLRPTLAQSPEYPQRTLYLGLTVLFLL
ncbi:sugar transporter, partial [Sulfitobacter sp. HI0082]